MDYLVNTIKNTINVCRNVKYYTKLLYNRYNRYGHIGQITSICLIYEMSTNRHIYKEI